MANEEATDEIEGGRLDAAAAAAILRAHLDAGVDETLSEAPLDWSTFRASAPLPTETAGRRDAPARAPAAGAGAGRGAPAAPAAAPAGGNAAMAARAEAASAASLAELRAILEGFEGCPLRHTARNLVFGAGDPAAAVMFVGEAPGREEDMEGVPFVGRSGRLLERMLAAIGLSREDVFISNVLPWRPPGNSPPSDADVATCLPFVVRQIELVAPRVLVCLGGAAAKTLLGRTDGITRLRGRWHAFESERATVDALATLHPAYLLRQPREKRRAWHDFLMLAERLEGGGATGAGR